MYRVAVVASAGSPMVAVLGSSKPVTAVALVVALLASLAFVSGMSIFGEGPLLYLVLHKAIALVTKWFISVDASCVAVVP